MSTEPTQRGRRAALLPKGRPDTATLLAAVLPVLTLGAALLVVPRAVPVVLHPDRGRPGAPRPGLPARPVRPG